MNHFCITPWACLIHAFRKYQKVIFKGNNQSCLNHVWRHLAFEKIHLVIYHKKNLNTLFVH